MQFNRLHKNGNYFYNSVEIGLDNGAHYITTARFLPSLLLYNDLAGSLDNFTTAPDSLCTTEFGAIKIDTILGYSLEAPFAESRTKPTTPGIIYSGNNPKFHKFVALYADGTIVEPEYFPSALLHDTNKDWLSR